MEQEKKDPPPSEESGDDKDHPDSIGDDEDASE